MISFEANTTIKGSLLVAARNHNHVELGDHITKVELYNSGIYFLVSNTYVALGRWSEATIARKII